MNRNKLCQLMGAYYDGQLSGEEVRKFQVHLKMCERCQHALQHLAKLSDFVSMGHDRHPEEQFFDAVWEQFENKLLRDETTLLDRMGSVYQQCVYTLRLIIKPALAACFILLLIMVPLFERKGGNVVQAQDVQIKKVESRSMHILLLKTKNKKWTVIWVIPVKTEEEQ